MVLAGARGGAAQMYGPAGAATQPGIDPQPGWDANQPAGEWATAAPYGGHDGYSGHAVTAPGRASAVYTPPALPPAGPFTTADVVSPCDAFPCDSRCSVQILPQGLLYRSYLAGEKEPRISSAWLRETDRGLVWDNTLGGRAGLWRYGTLDPVHPQGFQLDVEGAVMVRLDPEQHTDVEAADFRFGLLGTWRDGPWSAKWGYYHISSHLGDEFLINNPGYPRRNYVRDSAIAGLSFDATAAFRFYAEAAYAIGHEGGALPWEFQYGLEYSSPETTGLGGPFAGVNGHTREDEGWITGLNVISGWQWRGSESQHRFRVGMQYYHGPALQYSFVGQTETLLGGGMWFDF